ncbi:hypothetical protein BB559_004962 [Furculomyces boomerangus]|uniref:Uncharacterized protein n=2 Tax=Harpellales TaxID=61421 RepID=A0A2T9YBU0_9FUNG|nr:hypothetical protein BB559_004962 [Furculomyces boomerangus]PWA01337.1 hypothetical protein BB558_002569 [Smittium angustum]
MSDSSDSESLDITNLLVPVGNPSKNKNTKKSFTKNSSIIDTDQSSDDEDIQNEIRKVNRKKSKSGGFSLMGFSEGILNAIKKKGYKQPTPVQRKVIPKALSGRDVVGMARTGSGKTASFLLPIIEKLKVHKQQVGIRSLIILPNRELAIQIYNEVVWFVVNSKSNLRAGLIVGGDSLETQFNMMVTENPDIVISTPGRLLHVAIEMELSFDLVEIVCFDEADRLFEMGFAVQLGELLTRLPKSRQTLMFSATLPATLVEFVKAGLVDPEFVRLDKEMKLSENLSMAFFVVQNQNKDAALVHLLNTIEQNKQTIVFCATKHNVEYLANLLMKFDFKVSFVYGSMDQTNRQIQMNRFRKNLTNILVVTDLAARGLDIPILENVINYNFADNTKVFVHRVGRVARAGRSGWAYSILSPDELPYFIDLQLFLDKPMHYGSTGGQVDYVNSLVVGQIPFDVTHIESERITSLLETDINISDMARVAENGLKRYNKTKHPPSSASYKRSKELIESKAIYEVHPLFKDSFDSDRMDIIKSISSFKPNQTVFEVGVRGNKIGTNPAASAMLKFRSANSDFIATTQEKRKNNLVVPKSFVDTEFYISNVKADANTEKGYSMLKEYDEVGFEKEEFCEGIGYRKRQQEVDNDRKWNETSIFI